MLNPELKLAMKNTFAELRRLEDELYRPQEDVVTLFICFHVRRTILEMMQHYLSSQKVEYSSGSSLDDLIALCSNHDPEFGNIDITSIHCREHDDPNYVTESCSASGHVEACVVIANDMKSVILGKLNLPEHELI